VLIPPHKFVRPPCWYYRLKGIIKYDFRVGPNGITSIPNTIQIRPAVLELNHADRQTDMVSPLCVNFVHIVQRRIITLCSGGFSTQKIKNWWAVSMCALHSVLSVRRSDTLFLHYNIKQWITFEQSTWNSTVMFISQVDRSAFQNAFPTMLYINPIVKFLILLC
jgi:hypothetical protein